MSEDPNKDGAAGDDPVVVPEDPTELKAQYEKLMEENKKLKDKELNFQKLRTKKESEISAEKKEELGSIQDQIREMEKGLEEKHRQFVESQFNQARDTKLKSLVGDDADLREKVLYHYDRLKDETTTAEDVAKKLNDAYILATGEMPQKANPIYRTASAASPPNYQSKGRSFADTDEGTGTLKQWFPNVGWDKK